MLKRVMVIDDSDADLLFTQIILERSGAIAEVLPFESAKDALDSLAQLGCDSIDVILLDINMPEMNGFEFLRAYENLVGGRRAQAVVVMLTSSPDPQDRARALAHASVAGYVVKPIDVEAARDLVRVVQGLDPSKP